MNLFFLWTVDQFCFKVVICCLDDNGSDTGLLSLPKSLSFLFITVYCQYSSDIIAPADQSGSLPRIGQVHNGR